MTYISRFREDMQDELQNQIDALRRDVATLRKDVARRGGRAYRQSRNAGDEFVDILREYVEYTLPEIRRRARGVRKSARRHPFTSATVAAVSLIALGLAASMLMRR